MNLAKRIRNRRKALGLTLKAAARRYGCKHPYWCAVEAGRRSLTIKTLRKFAQVLRCNPTDLL